METMVWPSIILASAVPIVLIGGVVQRILGAKGMGWQFLRYTVISAGLPVVGVLALNDAITSDVSTLFAAVIGFASGQMGSD